MIVQQFIRWCEKASVAERCKAVEILAGAVLGDRFSALDTRAAEAALYLSLDDPSPKVRLTLAAKVAASHQVSRQLVLRLVEDVEPVACLVAASSPLLGDADLVDLVASGSARVRSAIAGRRTVSPQVAAAIAEVGGRDAGLDLLRNEAATIARSTLSRLADIHGHDPQMREALFGRSDLPAETRQMLLLHLGHDLAAMPLARHAVGADGMQRVVLDACEQATFELAGWMPADETPALVEHLERSGQLTPAFLVRAVCTGNIDLFAAALSSLSDYSPRRVRAILVDGREPAFRSLMREGGLPAELAPLLIAAVQIWKEVSARHLVADESEMAALVMERVVLQFRRRGDSQGYEKLEMLLHRLANQTARASARRRAEEFLAA